MIKFLQAPGLLCGPSTRRNFKNFDFSFWGKQCDFLNCTFLADFFSTVEPSGKDSIFFSNHAKSQRKCNSCKILQLLRIVLLKVVLFPIRCMYENLNKLCIHYPAKCFLLDSCKKQMNYALHWNFDLKSWFVLCEIRSHSIEKLPLLPYDDMSEKATFTKCGFFIASCICLLKKFMIWVEPFDNINSWAICHILWMHRWHINYMCPLGFFLCFLHRYPDPKLLFIHT